VLLAEIKAAEATGTFTVDWPERVKPTTADTTTSTAISSRGRFFIFYLVPNTVLIITIIS
jgi:hypothetical protein